MKKVALVGDKMTNKKSKTKNPQTLKEQYDAVIDMMDKEQLESTSNNINIRKLGADMLPSEFTSGVDYVADKSVNANPNFQKFAETERFAKEVGINGLEESIRQNKGTTHFGKTDSTADKKVK